MSKRQSVAANSHSHLTGNLRSRRRLFLGNLYRPPATLTANNASGQRTVVNAIANGLSAAVRETGENQIETRIAIRVSRPAQSRGDFHRNSRIVGYHELSLRPSSHRQTGM
jgi:hypothetical protein